VTLDSFLARYWPALESEMRASLQSTTVDAPELMGMLHYHLGWADRNLAQVEGPTGKRIRPALCLLSCEACGGSWPEAIPAAGALELLHNFSLIHDDIQDQDETRRGRPTLWALWGTAQAINAGDALFALSQLALLRLADRGVSPACTLQGIRLFNQACLAITNGQYSDISFEGRPAVPVGDYLAMIEGKTAALVAVACEMGALVALGAGPEGTERSDTCRKEMRSFGRHLGLSFQMQDDVLGIWGDPETTGKPAGADIIRRKKSLPILHGLERSAELRSLFAQENLVESDVQCAKHLLVESGSRVFADELAREHHERALAALDRARPLGQPAAALRELVNRLLGRDR
jgi:geranylgeranyl diphosphate synthase type I